MQIERYLLIVSDPKAFKMDLKLSELQNTKSYFVFFFVYSTLPSVSRKAATWGRYFLLYL